MATDDLGFPLLSLQLGLAGIFQPSTIEHRPGPELKVIKFFVFILGFNSLDCTISESNKVSSISSTDSYGVSNMSCALGFKSEHKIFSQPP